MEFGSDFHKIKDYPNGKSILDIHKNCCLYADGRQALEDILLFENIKRVWFPSYYCHESIEGVRRLGIKVEFYQCTPLSDQNRAISNLPLEHGNALVRMNYFGLNSRPKTPYGQFLLIEDHSHNLISDWSSKSEADWCFASLRKTLPIPDGGILWSPKKRILPPQPSYSQLAFHNSFRRNAAMEMKSDYLDGKSSSKEDYLTEFRITEDNFGFIPISSISEVAKGIVKDLDLKEWYNLKKSNWSQLLKRLKPSDSYEILAPVLDNDTPFSLIMLFESNYEREKIRCNLISSEVYPAVLWHIPEGNDTQSLDFGNRMLSIHCDARYTEDDMVELANIINKTVVND